MKKSLLFAAVVCGTLAATSAMAGDVSTDFHALSAMSSPVTAMTETQMSSVEGGLLTFLDFHLETDAGLFLTALLGGVVGSVDGVLGAVLTAVFGLLPR